MSHRPQTKSGSKCNALWRWQRLKNVSQNSKPTGRIVYWNEASFNSSFVELVIAKLHWRLQCYASVWALHYTLLVLPSHLFKQPEQYVGYGGCIWATQAEIIIGCCLQVTPLTNYSEQFIATWLFCDFDLNIKIVTVFEIHGIFGAWFCDIFFKDMFTWQVCKHNWNWFV